MKDAQKAGLEGSMNNLVNLQAQQKQSSPQSPEAENKSPREIRRFSLETPSGDHPTNIEVMPGEQARAEGGADEQINNKSDSRNAHFTNKFESVAPKHLQISPAVKSRNSNGMEARTGNDIEMVDVIADGDGTEEELETFMKELETFHKEKSLDFKPPKFYGEPLNCLKLWRAVIRLGGYDRVTASKLWRQVGETFHPPKTCTTVSWTFRIFYEKALLEYEKNKRQSGELQLPFAPLPESTIIENDASDLKTPVPGLGLGSGRARRDAAARAMQGWHAQRLYGYGEVVEPIIKDRSLSSSQKREKHVKSIGSVKQKKPTNLEHTEKVAHDEADTQVESEIIDVGPPADWVKINVRQTKDSFEVYALVPGLLREEVRVQSDPAGRLVITGQPDQIDNPWGITPFKKVVSLPGRINPLETSAVVSLHGRLFVRVPFAE